MSLVIVLCPLGIFTCGVKGLYQFTFAAMDNTYSWYVWIDMYKNDQVLINNAQYNNHGFPQYVSNGLMLELEEGDRVQMRLPGGFRLADSSYCHNVFSGFLLYAM